MVDVRLGSDRAKGWGLDKKIPIALIIAMIVQTGTVLVVGTAWVAQTNQRLQHIEKFIENNNFAPRLAAIEAKIDMLMNRNPKENQR